MKKIFLIKAKTKISKILTFIFRVTNFKNKPKWFVENHFGIFNSNSAKLKSMIQRNLIEIALPIKKCQGKIMSLKKR